MPVYARLVSLVPRAVVRSRAALVGKRVFASSGTVRNDAANEAAIRDLFMSYARSDSPRADPRLRVEDLNDLLVSIGERPSDDRLRHIIDVVGKQDSGSVDLNEFLNGCDSILGCSGNADGDPAELESLAQTFRTLDLNGNGVISKGELGGLLSVTGGHIDKKEARALMKLADTSGSKSIDFSEFVALSKNPAAVRHFWRMRSGFRAAFVVGGPRSGKTLLCDRLVREAGMQHCDSGNMIREEAASGSPLGNEIDAAMKKGWLIPSSTVMALLKKKLSTYPGAFVALDGFPRSKRNCRDFEKVFGAPEFAIYIDVPEEVMMERILHDNTRKGIPQDNDSFEAAKNRIQAFHGLAKPMLEYLYKAGIPVHSLDGCMFPDEIWDQLLHLNLLIRHRAESKFEEVAPEQVAQ